MLLLLHVRFLLLLLFDPCWVAAPHSPVYYVYCIRNLPCGFCSLLLAFGLWPASCIRFVLGEGSTLPTRDLLPTPLPGAWARQACHLVCGFFLSGLVCWLLACYLLLACSLLQPSFLSKLSLALAP